MPPCLRVEIWEYAMNIRVGSAPDSWGVWFASDPKQTPWQRYLDEVAEAGYEWTELGPYGYLPTDPPTLSAELNKRGLKVTASVVMTNLEDPAFWPEVERQTLGVGEQLPAQAAQFRVLPAHPYTDRPPGAPPGPTRLDQSAWKRLIDTTHRVADIARERFGLTLTYHPHAETHVEYEDQIEQFLA